MSDAPWGVVDANRLLLKDGVGLLTDIAAGVEAATHKARLPSEVAEERTARVCAAVQRAPQPERNLTAQQLKAVGSLKKMK